MLINNKYLKKLSKTELEALLKLTIRKFTELSVWDAENIQQILNKLLKESNKKPAELFSLIRISLSFAQFSPALNLTMETLGKDICLARLNTVTRSL